MEKSLKKGIIIIFIVCLTFMSSWMTKDVWAKASSATTPKLSKTQMVLCKGQSTQLKIAGSDMKASWSSDKKSVASVKNGKVTAQGKGMAIITAKVGTKKLVCKVTVETPALSKKAVTLEVGKKVAIKLNGTSQKVSWESRDTSIATVRDGRIVGKRKGNTQVYAQVNGKKYTCKVTVKQAQKKYLLEAYKKGDKWNQKSEYTLKKGKTITLECEWTTFKLEYNMWLGETPISIPVKKVKWTSANNNVAVVSAEGKIKAISEGETLITGSYKNLECHVSIKVPCTHEYGIETVIFKNKLEGAVFEPEWYISSCMGHETFDAAGREGVHITAFFEKGKPNLSLTYTTLDDMDFRFKEGFKKSYVINSAKDPSALVWRRLQNGSQPSLGKLVVIKDSGVVLGEYYIFFGWGYKEWAS